MAIIESENKKETKNNEEVDLLKILSAVWQGAGSALRATSLFLIRKVLWLACFILLGGGVACLFYLISERYYTSTMMAQVNVLSNSYVVDYVTQLGKITNPAARAKVLDIPEIAARHVADISAFFGVDTDSDKNPDYIDVNNSFQFDIKDSTKRIVPKIFYVRVKVSEENTFPLVSRGIITALQNNPHLVEQNRVRIDQLNERLAAYEAQYKRLDSLERYEYFNSERLNLRATGQVLVLNEKERQLYHYHLMSIYNNIQQCRKEIILYREPVTILQDFPTLSVADNPLMSYITRWVLVFLAIGIVFLVIRDQWAKIWRLITETQA
jgi:hypothetical protein